jgi:hypothetical protein
VNFIDKFMFYINSKVNMKCNVGLLFKSKFLDQTGMHSAKIYFAYPKREIVNSYFLCVKNLKRNRIKNTDPDKSFMGW